MKPWRWTRCCAYLERSLLCEARHTPRVVTSVSGSTALYARRVQFRSLAPAGPHPLPSTSWIVGIGHRMQAERFCFAQANLVPLPN